MNFAIDAVVLDVVEDLSLQEIVAVLVKLMCRSNQCWQPVRRLPHPAFFAAFERRVAFFGAPEERIEADVALLQELMRRASLVLDAEPIESSNQPLAAVDLLHTDSAAELFR